MHTRTLALCSPHSPSFVWFSRSLLLYPVMVHSRDPILSLREDELRADICAWTAPHVMVYSQSGVSIMRTLGQLDSSAPSVAEPRHALARALVPIR